MNASDTGGNVNFVGNQTAAQLICGLAYRNFVPPGDEIWCSWAWDSILCWPPTKASTSARHRCPRENGIDTTKFVEKRCGDDGQWEGREGSYGIRGGSSSPGNPSVSTNGPHGWTNYTPCFTPEMLQLIRKLYSGSEDAAKVKLDIAEKTRTLEIIGFSVSLAALLASLAIFCHFRSLRNTRTRIHKNLFVAMVIQVVIRLTLYIDQALLRTAEATGVTRGIQNTPFLCEASYVLLEYARTAMFMWMFIEGLYLHNVITVTVFQETSYYRTYRLVGWGYPVLMTLTWAVVTAFYYRPSNPTTYVSIFLVELEIFQYFRPQMLVGIQSDLLFLDPGGPEAGGYIAEFPVPVEHHSRSGGEIKTEPHERDRTSSESSQSSVGSTTAFRYNEFDFNGGSTAGQGSMGIRIVVVLDAFPDFVSRALCR
ncbi:PDF receptor isoform X3 [Athalia rosae]|uniref:PDF receptor isoform X3 n=1 Tax=Athalia rosae TaxID=37344 RepID=UPI0020346FCD|nr:PDF receptor isoform X3 [Athalia rosae]